MHIYHDENTRQLYVDDGTRIVSVDASKFDRLEISYLVQSRAVKALLKEVIAK